MLKNEHIFALLPYAGQHKNAGWPYKTSENTFPDTTKYDLMIFQSLQNFLYLVK